MTDEINPLPDSERRLEPSREQFERMRIRSFLVQSLLLFLVGVFAIIYSANESLFYRLGIRIPDVVGAYLGIMGVGLIFGSVFIALRMFLEFGDRFKVPAIGLSFRPFGLEFSLGERSLADASEEEIDVTPRSNKEPDTKADIICRRIRSRLKSEISAQGRKADLNLLVGGLLAIGAAGVLGWLASENAIYAQTKPNNVVPSVMLYWGAFLAKLALSITANVFAFFFLATYRRTLSEIKYFQNELTNVESKYLAVAIVGTDKKALHDIVKALLAVERNFILKKGETTVDLSQRESDRQELGALSSQINRVMDIAKDTKAAVTELRKPG